MIDYGCIGLILAVLRTKKELPVSEHRSYGHVTLISHPYGDSSAVYLGTVILTILCLKTPICNNIRTRVYS
jgi:hypothetical protein